MIKQKPSQILQCQKSDLKQEGNITTSVNAPSSQSRTVTEIQTERLDMKSDTKKKSFC